MVITLAYLRRLMFSSSYFVSLPVNHLSLLGDVAAVTVLNIKNRKHVTIIKSLNTKSRIMGTSVKMIIPKYVVDFIGANRGDYVWIRLQPREGADTRVPRYLFISNIKRVNKSGITISKRYIDVLASTLDVWRGDVYVSIRTLSGKRVATEKSVARLHRGRIYYIPITMRQLMPPVALVTIVPVPPSTTLEAIRVMPVPV